MILDQALCACGCGTSITPSRNHNTGQLTRFAHGHNMRGFLRKDSRYTIDQRTGCWNWNLFINSKGYGQVGVVGERRLTLAHIALWEEKYGPTPDGLELDHKCRNPRCVNPEHMEPVTHKENVRRGLCAKITAADVLVMRDLWKAGMKQAEIAVKYGLHHSHVSRIVRGVYWGDVTRPVSA